MHSLGPYKTYGRFFILSCETCMILSAWAGFWMCVYACVSDHTTSGLYVSVRGRTEAPAKMRAKAVFKRPSLWTWLGKCWTEFWVCSQAFQTSHKQALEENLYKLRFEISVLCWADEATLVQYIAAHNRLQSWLWRPRNIILKENHLNSETWEN